MTNHLGNVLVAITDRKQQVPRQDTLIKYFEPDVVSAIDYASFGLEMPGRKYGTAGRYGFNGMERVKDMNSLTAYDYGFRIYNRAIGKFLNVDR